MYKISTILTTDKTGYVAIIRTDHNGKTETINITTAHRRREQLQEELTQLTTVINEYNKMKAEENQLRLF